MATILDGEEARSGNIVPILPARLPGPFIVPGSGLQSGPILSFSRLDHGPLSIHPR
jgi:hypothetical protein